MTGETGIALRGLFATDMKKKLTVLVIALAVAASCKSHNNPVLQPPTNGNGGNPSGQKVNMWAIDMTPLEIGGKYYAIWSGWDRYYVNSEGNGQYLYISEMTFHDSYPKVRLGKRVLLSFPTKSWEIKVGEAFSLLEGPQVLKHDDDVFIIYSTRGSWTVNYKLGQLRLEAGKDPLDPVSWKKKEDPVFTGLQRPGTAGSENGQWGVGHASFTTSPDDTQWWIYYHSKTEQSGGWNDRKAFLQAFTFDADGDPVFGAPADSRDPILRPSGETEIERTAGVVSPSSVFTNPVHAGADPWIVKHGGLYYTCRSWSGIFITESPYPTKFVSRTKAGDRTIYGTDPISWDEAKIKVFTPAGNQSDKWNRISFWAPELHYINDNWYIFYAAGKQTEAPYWEHRAGVLVSLTGRPEGPYEEHDSNPLFTGEIIDDIPD